jgi:xanthine dehydrogenase accessory factor
MSETAEVLSAIEEAGDRGDKMALATIVGVTGSTYRRPGARLLVSEPGGMVGNLSGGCLEGEVQDVARSVMTDGEARLELYDLTADDEVVWGWGLGCNGAIEVFIEPADKAAEIAGALRRAIAEDRPVAVATVLESSWPGVERGDRLLIDSDGVEGRLGNEAAHEAVAAAAASALEASRTGIETVRMGGGELRVFFESIRPPLRLLVCGAGHDAVPLVALGASLGWSVSVIDDRESLLTSDRFPGARGFIKTEPIKAPEAAGDGELPYVVVMSHNYLRDRDYLKAWLGSGFAYLGMLGPRARLLHVHGPAGLDVGAEGPEEIAAAITAEILATSRGRSAGFLRDRSGPIHARTKQPAPAGKPAATAGERARSC